MLSGAGGWRTIRGIRRRGFICIAAPLGAVVGLGNLEARTRAEVSLAIRARVAREGYAATVAGLAPHALAKDCDERNVIRLGHLVQLADEFDPQATLRAGDFIRYVEATSVEEPNPAAVRVMTVHKSKGLEFDAVVLPELDRVMDNEKRGCRFMWRKRERAFAGPATAVYRRRRGKSCGRCRRELDGGVLAGAVQRRLRDDLCGLYVAK